MTLWRDALASFLGRWRHRRNVAVRVAMRAPIPPRAPGNATDPKRPSYWRLEP